MFEEVRNLLVEELGINEEDITPDSELVNDLGINSLDLADLIFQCESKYGIEISDEEITKFQTVGDVATTLAKMTGKDAD